MPNSLAVALLIMIATRSLAAQSLPLVSVELTTGSGSHSERAGEVWYYPQSAGLMRAGISLRIGSAGRVRPIVSVDRSDDRNQDMTALCAIAPNGSCRQSFPSIEGVALGAGVRAVVLPRLTLGSTVGISRLAPSARYVDADAAVGITRHFHLVAHWRHVAWTPDGAERQWYRPLTVGVRLQ